MVPNIGTILSLPENPLNFSLFTINIERQRLRKQERRPCMTTVTREELKAKMDRGDSFRLVEALPEASFLEGHLPGAVNMPKGERKGAGPEVAAGQGGGGDRLLFQVHLNRLRNGRPCFGGPGLSERESLQRREKGLARGRFAS
jgi:hypothetical protein